MVQGDDERADVHATPQPAAGTGPDLGNALAFGRSVAHFARPKGPDLLARTEALHRWYLARLDAGVWPYGRTLESAPRSSATLRDSRGRASEGINLASQDYLALGSHPAVHEAAVDAIRTFGVHTGGAAILSGNTTLSRRLEASLAELTAMPEVLLFPTGWAAAFGTIVGLVRPYDHVLLDERAHGSLQQGAHAATPHVRTHPHLDVDAARAELQDIRRRDTEGGIMVVTEGLYSMDSDVPNLRDLLEVTREHGATLLVDVAHDLGSSGPGGTGQIGEQRLLGQVDLVVGAFSKTFASNGGFLAVNRPAVRTFVSGYGTSWVFSNALSPPQVAVALEALRIVRSAEGDELRDRLARNVDTLRSGLTSRGLVCHGVPSPIVPVLLGTQRVARVAASLLHARGVMANLVEFPAVRAGTARFRMQVMASHTPQQLETAANVTAEVVEEATSMAGDEPTR